MNCVNHESAALTRIVSAQAIINGYSHNSRVVITSSMKICSMAGSSTPGAISRSPLQKRTSATALTFSMSGSSVRKTPRRVPRGRKAGVGVNVNATLENARANAAAEYRQRPRAGSLM